VSLIDHHHVVLRQHGRIGHRIDGQQRVIGHHHIRLRRLGTRELREALFAERAPRGTQALARSHGDLAPGLIADTAFQVVAVSIFSLIGPLVQVLDLRTGVGNLLGGEQGFGIGMHTRIAVGLLRAAVHLVEAQIVIAALEDRRFQRPGKLIFEGLAQPREVALHQLALQGDGGGGDDHWQVIAPGALNSRD